MPQVLKNGLAKPKLYATVTCHNCKSVIKFEREEVQDRNHVDCPVCKAYLSSYMDPWLPEEPSKT